MTYQETHPASVEHISSFTWTFH